MGEFEEYDAHIEPTQVIYMPYNQDTEAIPELPAAAVGETMEIPKLPDRPIKRRGRLNFWPTLFIVAGLWLAFMGGGMVGRATAPVPTYQALTQDTTIPALLHAAGTGRNVHFTGRVVKSDTSTGFEFDLLSDPKNSVDQVVVLAPIADALMVKPGQLVQVWGYCYGEYVSNAGIETLVVAQEVK